MVGLSLIEQKLDLQRNSLETQPQVGFTYSSCIAEVRLKK